MNIDGQKIKECLISVISTGERSPKLKQFHELCKQFSKACLCLNNNRMIRDELLKKMDYSLDDLAYDCIDELFRTENNKFIELENYFNKKISGNIEEVHPDKISALFGALIKSKTNQQLSELREKFGDIYFKIRKAISTEIKRKNKVYVEIYSEGKKFIGLNHNTDLCMHLPDISKNWLLPKMFEIKLKKYEVTKMLFETLQIINSQNEYSKRIEDKMLFEILKDFYNSKINDVIEKNVEYKVDIEEMFDSSENESEYYERN